MLRVVEDSDAYLSRGRRVVQHIDAAVLLPQPLEPSESARCRDHSRSAHSANKLVRRRQRLLHCIRLGTNRTQERLYQRGMRHDDHGLAFLDARRPLLRQGGDVMQTVGEALQNHAKALSAGRRCPARARSPQREDHAEAEAHYGSAPALPAPKIHLVEHG
eukprot:scaffold2173_cov250-Pinguiococcus_pyrenoidosus.AAC.5